jgi:hypothetical protein
MVAFLEAIGRRFRGRFFGTQTFGRLNTVNWIFLAGSSDPVRNFSLARFDSYILSHSFLDSFLWGLTMTMISRILIAIPLLLTLTVGCEKNPNAPSGVSGKVTYKGEVVPAGTITFHAPKGGIFSYSLTDGKYSGSQLPAEEMIVTIETESLNPNVTKPTYGMGGNKAGAPDQQRAKMEELGRLPKSAAPANAGPYVKIPAKYATKDKSPLKVKLTNGSNANDFELTD